MDTHFKIPEKKDYTWLMIGSMLVFVIGLIYGFMFAIGKPTLLSKHGFVFEFTVIVWSISILPVTLAVYYQNRAKYYNPAKRTMTICAPEDLFDWLNDKPFIFYNTPGDNEGFLLQGDFNEKEKFYMYLALKKDYLSAFKQSIKSFELKHGGVVFLTFTSGFAPGHPSSERIFIKFWSMQSSEKAFDLGLSGGNECFS